MLVRVNPEVQKALASIISKFDDSELSNALISIMKVDTFSDFSMSKVYVSVFGDENAQKDAIDGLKNAAGFVRKELAHRLGLRYTPEILFTLDNSIEHGAHINKLLNDINK